MKKIFNYILLFVMVLTLSGCYRIHVNTTINKDKSLDIEMIIAIDEKKMASLGGSEGEASEGIADEETIAEYKKQGFEVEDYVDGDYKGVKLTRKITNIDEVTSDKKIETNLGSIATGEEGGKYLFYKEGNVYYSDIILNTEDTEKPEDDVIVEEEDPNGDEAEDGLLTTAAPDDITGTNDGTLVAPEDDTTGLEDMDLSSYFDIKYTVTLPSKAISHNATKVDGNTYTWDYKYGQADHMTYSFSFPEGNFLQNNILYIGIAALSVIIFVVTLVVVTKKNKETNVNNAQ